MEHFCSLEKTAVNPGMSFVTLVSNPTSSVICVIYTLQCFLSNNVLDSLMVNPKLSSISCSTTILVFSSKIWGSYTYWVGGKEPSPLSLLAIGFGGPVVFALGHCVFYHRFDRFL